jgi:hypothetical protein
VPLDVVASTLGRIKNRMKELGRDPSRFRLRLNPEPIICDGKLDVDATLAAIPKLADIGCTDVDLFVPAFCNGPDDFESFLEKYLRYKT